MRDFFWAIIAIFGLLVLVLIALGLRFQSANKSGLVVSNIFEDGLLFGIFAICFAPAYLAWMGMRSVWVRLWPGAGLPTDGDDPVWGRRVNRQVVETAFLAIQDARINHNANLAKRYISQELFRRLRRDCDLNSREARSDLWVKIKDIVFADERIEQNLCYFNATVTAILQSDGTQRVDEPEEFEAHLEFARALPAVHDARWQLMNISGP